MNREGINARTQGHTRCGKEYGMYGYPGDYLPLPPEMVVVSASHRWGLGSDWVPERTLFFESV
jgi:hypothetical protein